MTKNKSYLTLLIVICFIIISISVIIAINEGKGNEIEDPKNNMEGNTKVSEKNDLEEIETINLKDIFPLKEGNIWKYRGEGNEYASFSREVLYIQGDKIQMVEDNGGTISAIIFEITDKTIKRIYSKSEVYDRKNLIDQEANDDLIILKAPIRIGEKWETYEGTREIIDINTTVDTTIGKFENCIKIKIDAENSTMYEYYKVGIGLIKREFISEGMEVTSTLEEFTTK